MKLYGYSPEDFLSVYTLLGSMQAEQQTVSAEPCLGLVWHRQSE